HEHDRRPHAHLASLGHERQPFDVEPQARPVHLDVQSSLRAAGTLAMRCHHRPMSVGALIGREREVSTLARMLADDDLRLVTVTGPPGVGKTRLAYAVADRVRTERKLRLVRVELGPVGDAGRVTEAIAAAACAGDAAPRRTALADAAAALKETPALLVLDNFEHVAEAATDVATLLDACPDLTVLTTSRHVL